MAHARCAGMGPETKRKRREAAGKRKWFLGNKDKINVRRREIYRSSYREPKQRKPGLHGEAFRIYKRNWMRRDRMIKRLAEGLSKDMPRQILEMAEMEGGV